MKKLILTATLVFMVSGVSFASPLMDYSKGSVGFDYTYRPNLSMSGTGEVSGTITHTPEMGLTSTAYNSTPFSLSGSKDFDGSANLDAGVTIGLGNNWAVQYRQYNPKGTILSGSWSPKSNPDGEPTLFATESSTRYINYNIEGKIRSDEFNVLYKVSPKASAFMGIVRTNTGIKPSFSGMIYGSSFAADIPELKSDDRNIFQVGLLGSTHLADKLTGYGIVSFGSSDYRNWQAGLSYEFSPKWEFDVNYRSTKFGKYKIAAGSISTSDGSVSADLNVKDVEAKGWGFGLVYKF